MSPSEVVRTAFLPATSENLGLVFAARFVVIHALVMVLAAVELLWLLL